ncbi:MAG: hypothetical protein DMG06_05885 [Acidobacteria bacterium]|nr:MAG: hypothetical protein DMG06_05885 [Acidobacteriota bacterium]
MNSQGGWSRRNFLQTMGGAVPTLKLLLEAPADRANPLGSEKGGKFKPIDLTPYFTSSPLDFGPRPQAKELGGASAQDGLIRTPTGKQDFRGIPFWLGPEGTKERSWVVLSNRNSGGTKQSIEVPIKQKASFLCLAGFCDWDENEHPSPNQDVIEKVGQKLAEAIFVYEDGTEKVLPIRRRFEVNAPSISWGHQSFASLAHVEDTPRKLTDPLSDALQWGDLQTSVWENTYGAGPDGKPSTLPWICLCGLRPPAMILWFFVA